MKIHEIKEKIINWKPLVSLVQKSKKVSLPGFEKVPVFDVSLFFIRGLQKGAISTRASSVAFTFFMAIFPSVIFFFTLIPYVPVDDFKDTLLQLVYDFFPKETYEAVNNTIEDIILRKRGGLLSFGFLMALYLSTNGINALMTAFNQTYHSLETRSSLKKRLLSLILVIVISLIVIIGIILITGGTFALNYLVKQEILTSQWTYYLIAVGRWVVLYIMVFLVISMLYYFAPADKKQFRFISVGSTVATLLSILTTIGFNFYVSNLSHYNAVYGSIGTIIIILLWLYFNSTIIILGFELNASIHDAKKEKGADMLKPGKEE